MRCLLPFFAVACRPAIVNADAVTNAVLGVTIIAVAVPVLTVIVFDLEAVGIVVQAKEVIAK